MNPVLAGINRNSPVGDSHAFISGKSVTVRVYHNCRIGDNHSHVRLNAFVSRVYCEFAILDGDIV